MPPDPSRVIERVDVLGVEISCTDIPNAVESIATWIAEGERQYVCVTGMHGVMESRNDTALRSVHNDAGLTTADGMPMVWAGRWAGSKAIARVYGPDLMEALLARGAREGWTSYFVGGGPGVAEKLTLRLRESNPAIAVVGHASPPFRPVSESEDRELTDAINQAGPDIVWVGLGTPKQELWMAAHRPVLQAPVLIGVGAAFDYGAGTLRQAPRWMQRHGLEWLFRLAVEPRRLWRRYMVNIPRFVAGLLRDRPRLVER